jgi:hypothetical protein
MKDDNIQDNGNNVHVNMDATQLSLDFVEVGLVKARRATWGFGATIGSAVWRPKTLGPHI